MMRFTSAGFKRVLEEFTRSERRMWWRIVAGGMVGFALVSAAFALYESTQPPPVDCEVRVERAVAECRRAIETLEKQIDAQNARLDLLWQLRTAGSVLMPFVAPPPPRMPHMPGLGQPYQPTHASTQ